MFFNFFYNFFFYIKSGLLIGSIINSFSSLWTRLSVTNHKQIGFFILAQSNVIINLVDIIENHENELAWWEWYKPSLPYCTETSFLYSCIFAFVMLRFKVVRRLYVSLNAFAETIFGVEKALEYNNVIRKIFFWSIVANVGSLFPGYGFVVSGEFVFPFFYSILVFFTLFWYSVKAKGCMFTRNFYDPDIPRSVTTTVFIIELLSWQLRIVSLGLRMFVNSMAGGLLVKIFFCLILCGIVAYFPTWLFGESALITLVMMVFILEILVSVLQGFVFTLLFIIYLREVI